MASLGEMIALSRYKSGDMGRANLPTIQRDTPQEQQRKNLVLQNLAVELSIRQQQEARAKRERELWDSVGLAKDGDKSTRGIATNVVDNEEAGGRDIITVGSSKKPDADSGYEAAISKQGKMYLRPKGEAKPYDRVKVIDRAKKIVEAEMLEEGIDRTASGFANAFNVRLKKSIPQAEIDLYGENTTPFPAGPSYTSESEDNRPVNTTGLTSSPEDFMPEYKEKRGMVQVAKDFYFGKKDGASAGNASGGKVMIQTPDGKRGYIPQANLQKALQRGAKLVQ